MFESLKSSTDAPTAPGAKPEFGMELEPGTETESELGPESAQPKAVTQMAAATVLRAIRTIELSDFIVLMSN